VPLEVLALLVERLQGVAAVLVLPLEDGRELPGDAPLGLGGGKRIAIRRRHAPLLRGAPRRRGIPDTLPIRPDAARGSGSARCGWMAPASSVAFSVLSRWNARRTGRSRPILRRGGLWPRRPW